uniref:Phospholipase A2 n=1 Tax=Neogobius melanostomus TaxID=47308 RepID=A0A8C6T7I4_9GOBI
MLCCFLAVSLGSMATHKSQRSKRGLLELAGAIKCSTGRSAFSYMTYGCYCGLGGQGWPRDKADWCCHRHDCCYGDAEALGCKPRHENISFQSMYERSIFYFNKDKCEESLCKCDRDAAKCLRRAPYNRRYTFWPDFMCGSKQPTCNIWKT